MKSIAKGEWPENLQDGDSLSQKGGLLVSIGIFCIATLSDHACTPVPPLLPWHSPEQPCPDSSLFSCDCGVWAEEGVECVSL